MARSPNSFIAVFQTRPRGGETHIHSASRFRSDSLYPRRLSSPWKGFREDLCSRANQGVLIPAGVHYGFTNTTERDVVFNYENGVERRAAVAYVANVPSDIHVKIPADEIGAKGFGRHIYVYAMDRSTIGISPLLMEEWNKACLLRMNCEYEKQDGVIIAKLPQRMTQWYKIDKAGGI